MDAAALDALIADTAGKVGLVWVRAAGPHHRAQAVWHVWHDGSVYVLTGGAEQPAPEGLTDRAFVTLARKMVGPRLVTLEATVSVVAPGSDSWNEVEPQLLAGRLNLTDRDEAPARWARECALLRLTPTGSIVETPEEPTTSSHAAPPPPTRARSRVTRPLHLRGRPARNRGGM